MKDMSFTLKRFIIDCKNLLPRYLKKVASSHSQTGLKIHKHVLITYLKEYFKHNSNKYNRNQFNVQFFHKFFQEIIPQDYPELYRIPMENLHKSVKSFFNYLKLKKVIRNKLSQDIARTLNREDELSGQILKDDEYSDRTHNLILNKSNKWANEFLNSEYSNSLTVEEKWEAGKVIEAFYSYLYQYFLKSPKQVDEEYVEEICLYIFPRKITAEESFFKAVCPVLNNFFGFLEDRGIMSNTKVLCKRLKKIRKKLIKAASKPENWGLAKTFCMSAEAAGFDISKPEDLITFKNLYNLSIDALSAEIPDLWRMEEVEALKTKEIIRKLKNFGIPFDKKQFLKEVHQYLSVEDLHRYWWSTYDISAKGKDQDFIWFACSILWKRLAPEVVSLENLRDMIEDCHYLISSRQYGEACKLWLKIWDHLQDRFIPGMESINKTEYAFEELRAIYSWFGELALDLHFVGKRKDPIFHDTKIEYCKTNLEAFSNHDYLYSSSTKRNMAESYFALDKEEEGERIFQEILDEAPDNTWTYISWGDQYADPQNTRYDFDKASSIYRLGLQKCNQDRDILLQRIDSLESH